MNKELTLTLYLRHVRIFEKSYSLRLTSYYRVHMIYNCVLRKTIQKLVSRHKVNYYYHHIICDWARDWIGNSTINSSYVRKSGDHCTCLSWFIDRCFWCVGYVTVEYSDIENSEIVREYGTRREYDIGTCMGLRLFKVNNNSVSFPAALGHATSGFVENQKPLDAYRNKKIKIEVCVVNGPKPDSYVDRISSIVDNAPLR
jgi:hypothetical protein